jgi:hypothetical protein
MRRLFLNVADFQILVRDIAVEELSLILKAVTNWQAPPDLYRTVHPLVASPEFYPGCRARES